ncbi:unnamed protein product [Cuscuta europaea]|uniref:Jacalin-type lectin domain-containing protein n=1 Tax=Cuscuta europaea TaxID=41803 RepID=A0A9P0ZGJ6_CUSEU|nr:unnamed protein product [Cuscuta europaea]
MEQIKLDPPTEFLTQVHGVQRRCSLPANTIKSYEVSSITFVTNKATYEPFGRKNSPSSGHTVFKFQLGSSADFISMDGFHGTVNPFGHIGSIGVYLQTTISAARPDLKRRASSS